MGLLKTYHQCFTFIATNVLRIDPEVAYDKPNIDPNVKSVQQKKMHHDPK